MFKSLMLKLLNRIDDLPIIDLIPLAVKAWNSLPEETQIEYLKNGFAAANKAAKQFAEK